MVATAGKLRPNTANTLVDTLLPSVELLLYLLEEASPNARNKLFSAYRMHALLTAMAQPRSGLQDSLVARASQLI